MYTLARPASFNELAASAASLVAAPAMRVPYDTLHLREIAEGLRPLPLNRHLLNFSCLRLNHSRRRHLFRSERRDGSVYLNCLETRPDPKQMSLDARLNTRTCHDESSITDRCILCKE